MWWAELFARGKCCMAGLERARVMLRMAHRDFNALVGMLENPLFADVRQSHNKGGWLRPALTHTALPGSSVKTK